MFAQVNPLSINFVSRVVVGVFLLLAAVSKLGLFPSFVKTLTNFRVVPQRCAAPTALAVLLAEFTTGVFLVGGLQTRLASYSAIALLTCFTIAILTNLVRRKKDRIGWHLLLRNTGLLGLTALSNLNTDARIHFFPRGIEGQGHIPEFLEH